MPPAWRSVVVVPRGQPGLAGDEEAAAFARLPPPPAREVERVAHLVLMQLLPALADADLPAFGAALAEVQRITGGWFAPVQGGVFAPGETAQLVARLGEWGAVGVGQSSWGPAVYGIVGEEAASRALAERARGVLEQAGGGDRKSTRLNSSHDQISDAVFCLKKKKTTTLQRLLQRVHPVNHFRYIERLLVV